MEEKREESELLGDCRVPLEETGKELGLASKTETLDGEVDKESCIEDGKAVEVSGSGVCVVSGADENPNDGGSVCDEKQVRVDDGSVEEDVEKAVRSDDVEKADALAELETERSQMKCGGNDGADDVKPVNGGSHASVGEEGNVDEDRCGASDAEQNVQTEKSQQNSVDGETVSVAEGEANQEKEDNTNMDVDNKQAKEEENVGSETKDEKHSESVQAQEESAQLSKEEANEETAGPVLEVSSAADICGEEDTTTVNHKEENGEAMEIDYTAEESVEKVVLDSTGNGSAGASMVPTQDVPIAEADKNDSNVVNEMEMDEGKDSADMATIESTANPTSSTEDAAPGEVEPLDHNALFDPRSDITNFIDFSGVSSWSGNIQDLKTETGSVSLKEDKKPTVMAEEVATEACNEALKSVGATTNAESRDKLVSSAEGVENESNEACVATDCPVEASDAVLESEENQEEKEHQSLDQRTVDQEDTRREEDDTTHEAPSIDPNQKEDTVMEENHDNSDYADVGTDSDIKTNGLKRKADVLSEDSLGEGRKTVSLAKVSYSQRPSFKIGACIARAASQMAGSPSVLKGSNFGDETLSVESFVSQLHSAATDPVKENIVSEIAAEFFLDFRNSLASQQFVPDKVSSKRGRPSNSNAGGTEAFEFEEMGDTYWTDRVIHNGGEEQTPATEKENYQVVPVELKPAQVKRTRRPYRRRQSQISYPLPPASDKPADFDENAPAELIMTFSETDTIPPEKSLSKMFRHFGPIRDSQTEVDEEKNRARVVFRKGADAHVAYNSAGRFNIFGTKSVNYELSFTITETFKVQPYVVSLGEEEAAVSLPS